MIPVCLCCGECRVAVQSAALVIPSVFNVQSDVLFAMGSPARTEEKKHLRDIQECLPPCTFVLYIVFFPELCSHEERNISVIHTDELLGETSTA